MLFIKIRQRSHPNTLPWDIPEITADQLDDLPFKTTRCYENLSYIFLRHSVHQSFVKSYLIIIKSAKIKMICNVHIIQYFVKFVVCGQI